MSGWYEIRRGNTATGRVLFAMNMADLAASLAYDETVHPLDGPPLFDAPPPPPVTLTGLQVLALYRPAQHARAKRMLFATYPVGHPQAGELVDPDGFTERLVDATLASSAIVLGGTEHAQGTAWMRAIGVIESDEEAARILAGITPEEAA